MNPEGTAPFYYLEHFSAVLRSLLDRDQDLLTGSEADFIARFFKLPLQPRALIARIAARSHALVCASSLHYGELTDLPGALGSLTRGQWLVGDPIVTMAELFAALPTADLATGFGLKARPMPRKETMLAQAEDLYTGPIALSRTHFRRKEPLYQFVHAGLCRRLCAQYFGNFHQDWSQYLIAERGIRRYEHVTFESDSRPFQSVKEVEYFHSLQQFTELLEANASAPDLPTSLPSPPASCGWLRMWHQRASYRLARRLERAGNLNAALALYQSVVSPEAEGRMRLISRRLAGQSRSAGVSRRAIPHFDLDLPHASERRIEQRVATQLRALEQRCDVQVVENRLFRALFGLLFWRALFAPVRGAFFHAFQTAPADLYDPQFCESRRVWLNQALQCLEDGGHGEVMRVTYQTKYGIANPWVPWWWLRSSLLDRALQCIPATDLLAVFRWMLSDLQHHVTGFPDLIQFWPDESRYRLIEVKWGTDRLQNNQRRFLQHAVEHQLPMSVCYVTAPSSPRPVTGERRLPRARRDLSSVPGNATRQGHLAL